MTPVHGRFAVVLNRNAKRVTDKIEELSGEIVRPDDLFLSSSAEESEQIAATLIERGYETVFAGGGDGTVMHLINQLAEYPLEQQPAIGILKLGTGNAMARMVSSGNLVGDLKTYVRSATREVVPISLIEAEGTKFPFAGLGTDAEILNDYKFVKENMGSSVMKPVVQTVGGYFLGLMARTIPRHVGTAVKGDPGVVRAVVTRGEAIRLGPDGEEVERLAEGSLLYEGSANICMVGTVPFYGYGMKVMPYANADLDRMQLRISNIAIAKALALLPTIWKGEYGGSDLNDFLVEQVQITSDVDAPYQVGGDAEGYRRDVTFTVVPRAVRLLKLI
jgi:diacylglycerol kinase family enzyme